MSKISTIYDKKIGKCLIVRGSEAYAHTTDVLMEVGTITKDHTDSFKATFILNVLRDVGSSQIAIYDNEELIKIVDWSDNQSSAIEIGTGTGDDEIRFSYNVDHNIYAKYLGNKECLPSRSKTLVLNEEVPSNLFTSISFGESPTTTFLTTVTIPVTLNAEGTSTQTLNYYIDGDTSNKQSVSVTTNTPTNITVTGVDNGLHTISFEFEETVNLAESYNEIVISKGAIVDLTVPSVLTHGQSAFSFGATIEDYFGDGINEYYYLNLSYDADLSITEFTNGTYIKNANQPQLEMDFTNIQFTDDSVLYDTIPLTVELEDSNHSTIDTWEVEMNVTRVTEFSMNLTKPYLVDNESTTITGSVNTASGVLENVAVKIGDATVYTNNVGEYSTDFVMTSQYDISVQARCGDKIVNKWAENVLFYYDRGNLDYNTDTNLSTFIGRSNVAVGTTASPKGIRFDGTSASQSYIQFKTSVHDNMKIEFDITELVNKEGTKLQGLYPFNGLKVGDHVLMNKKDKYVVAVNDEWRTSYSLDGSAWFTCQFGRNGSTSRLTANKIKIKRMRV